MRKNSLRKSEKSLKKNLTYTPVGGIIKTVKREHKTTTEGENMARFLAERYTMVSNGRCEYKGVKIGRAYWFEANSTDEAIDRLHAIMDDTTYILKIGTDNGFKLFYKAIKQRGAIKVLRDNR